MGYHTYLIQVNSITLKNNVTIKQSQIQSEF